MIAGGGAQKEKRKNGVKGKQISRRGMGPKVKGALNWTGGTSDTEWRERDPNGVQRRLATFPYYLEN